MLYGPPSETPVTAERALACSLLDEALMLLGVLVPPPVPLPATRQTALIGRKPVWNAETIRTAIQTFVAREGRAPTRSEWRYAAAHQLPGRSTVCAAYGSLGAAYAANGLLLPASRRGHTLGRWRQRKCPHA